MGMFLVPKYILLFFDNSSMFTNLIKCQNLLFLMKCRWDFIDRNERRTKIMVKYWRLDHYWYCWHRYSSIIQFSWLSTPWASFTNTLFWFESMPFHFWIFHNLLVVTIIFLYALLFFHLTFFFMTEHQYLF